MAAQFPHDPAMNGRGGLAVQLLVDDGFEQGFEEALGRAQFQGERADLFDDSRQSGIACAEMGEGLFWNVSEGLLHVGNNVRGSKTDKP